MKVVARSVLVLSVLSSTPMAHAEAAWVPWAHSYELWVDKNNDTHRRDVTWKKVNATAAKSECDDRRVREAQAEYSTLTGKGVGATLSGSEVGFDQKSTRFKRGYRSFECWPDTVDPRGPKGK